MKASAIAHSNIALIKYWGRVLDKDPDLNIPTNDSVSMTKLGFSSDVHLETHTTIDFSDIYAEDTAFLEGEILRGREMERILKVINSLRKLGNTDYNFKMVSRNDFPIQAGLASSAAGFAALTIATVNALSINLSKEEISTFARLGSGSATRSIYGGFVYWNKGYSHETSFAEQIRGPTEFNMHTIIAVIHEGKKAITSDIGHGLAHTSPFDSVRIKKSQEQANQIKKAILDDDFTTVGKIAEENAKYMHVVMMTSKPPLYYWHPHTLELIKLTPKIRKEGLECYFSIDAGPNVHYLCRSEDTYELRKILETKQYVHRIICAKPAHNSYVTKKHLF